MKIVHLTDLYADGTAQGSGLDTSDKELIEIYDIGEYDDEDGYVQFINRYGGRCGWFIGCAVAVEIGFDDGSSITFTDLRRPDRSRNSEKISAAIAELKQLLFADNSDDIPESDMPDIF